jgi:hypothetical protein
VAAAWPTSLRTKQETLRGNWPRGAGGARATRRRPEEDGQGRGRTSCKREPSTLNKEQRPKLSRWTRQSPTSRRVAKNQRLQAAGYFPLMRFGKHTVTAKDADGKVQFFGMYEGLPLVPRSGQYEANKVKAPNCAQPSRNGRWKPESRTTRSTSCTRA